MALLGDLPNETIIQIISNIEPQDIESISILCKRWHDLCSEILQQHRQLKKQYGHINDKDPLTIPQLLGVDNTRVLLYVRRLTFYCDRVNYHWWNRFPQRSLPTLKHSNYFKGDRLARVQQVYDAVHLPRDKTKDWMRMIGKGHDGPLKVLLMVSCPNLSTVVFTHRSLEGMQQMSFYQPPYSFDIMMDVLLGCPKPILDQLLPSLRRVYINCDGDGGFGLTNYESINMSPHYIKRFLELPSLSELQVANCINLRDSAHENQDLGTGSSPVKKLDLGTLFFTPRSLDDLLGGITALQGFSTQDATDDAAEVLLKYHKKSLETLHVGTRLSGKGHAHFGFNFLPHFPVLKSLCLDVSHLYRWAARPDQNCFVDLPTLLPKSLETLQIYGSQSEGSFNIKVTSQDLIDFLAAFVTTKSNTHPKLWGICLSRLDLHYRDSDVAMPVLRGLKASCKKNQVVLTTGNITTKGPCPYPPRQKDVDYVCDVCRSRVVKFGTYDGAALSQCFG